MRYGYPVAALMLGGQLTIQMRDRDVVLGPRELFIVPRGAEHCPRAVAAGLSDLAGSGPQRGLRRLSWLSQWSMPLLDVLPVGSLIELRGVKTCLVAPSRTSAAPAGQDAASRRWPRMRG